MMQLVVYPKAEILCKRRPDPPGTIHTLASGKKEKKIRPGYWKEVPKGTKEGKGDTSKEDDKPEKAINPIQHFKENGNFKETVKVLKDDQLIKLLNDINTGENLPKGWKKNINVTKHVINEMAERGLVGRESATVINSVGKVSKDELKRRAWNIKQKGSSKEGEKIVNQTITEYLNKAKKFIHNLFFKSKNIPVDEMDDSNFDPEQLKAGIKVEMEHVPDLLPKNASDEEKHKLACKVAKRHLTESKDYYINLKKYVEKDLKKSIRFTFIKKQCHAYQV